MDNIENKRDNNRRNHDERFIGRVRFYDSAKQFGFIDTNMFGLKEEQQPFETRELFFSWRDFKHDDTITGGDWVSFTVFRTPESKKDNARYIRRVGHDRRDFILAMQYNGSFSGITNKNAKYYYDEHSFDIKSSIIQLFAQSKDGRQVLFDHVVNIFCQNKNEASKDCFTNEPVVDILLEPEKHEVVVSDKGKYQTALVAVAISKIDRFRNGKCEISLAESFRGIVPLLNEVGKRELRDAISLLLAKDNRGTSSFLNYVPNQMLSDIFDDDLPNAETRLFLFSRLGARLETIKDVSVVDYWNQKIGTEILNKENWIRSSIIPVSMVSVPVDKTAFSEIVSYTLSTGKASDSLLFVLFLWSADARCLDAIKDMDAVLSNIVSDDKVLLDFLSMHSRIPAVLLIGTIKAIGLERLFKLTSYSVDLRTTLCFSLPADMAIDLLILVTTTSETQRTEQSDWYGGYWTWDEGMKHEKCNIKTYLDRVCSYKVYVHALDMNKVVPIINGDVIHVKELISNDLSTQTAKSAHLITDGNNNSKVLRLTYLVDGKDNNVQGMEECLCQTDQNVAILISSETIED